MENRILPVCKENLQWPDDVSIDLESVGASGIRVGPRRPRTDETPSGEDCERFRDRTLVINNTMRGKIGGYATTSSNRSQQRAVQMCTQSMTTQQVQCGIATRSNLDMLSCFSPYDVGSDRTWPTAEECETYGD